MDTIIIVVAIAIVILIVYLLVTRRMGGSEFWAIVGRNPDAAYEFFKLESCWYIVSDPANFSRSHLPEGSWAGPFRLVVPSLGNAVVHIYGRGDEYLQSEQRFIGLYQRHMSSDIVVPSDLDLGGDKNNPEAVDLPAILEVIIGSVGVVDTEVMVDQLLGIGLTERQYQDYGPSTGLPEFDSGYHFVLESTFSPKHLIEVLDKDGQILQAGIQVFGKGHTDLKRRFKDILTDEFGQGVSMSMPMAETVNYTGDLTIAYISDSKIPRAQSLTVRVGNNLFWNN